MSQRIQQLNAIVKNEVGAILLRFPAAQDFGLLTISRVSVSPDISYATVWVSPSNKEVDMMQLVNHLRRIRRDVQNEFASRIETKKTPKIKFKVDESGEYFENIESILDDIKHCDKM